MAYAYTYSRKIVSPVFENHEDAEYWYSHEKDSLEDEPVQLREVTATILVPLFPGSQNGRTVRW